MATEPLTFTFKDSGKTIKIRKVSPHLLNNLNKQFPPPPAPLVEVEYPNGIQMEPNENDPAYKAALKKWNMERSKRAQEFIFERGVVAELGEAERAEVAELRKWWADKYGCELEGDDWTVYLNCICFGTPEDMEDLGLAITHRSGVTKEAVLEAAKMFRAQS